MQTTLRSLSDHHTSSLSYPLLFSMSFLVWLGGTSALRFGGQFFFIPDNWLSMTGNFLALLVVMPLIIIGILRWQNIHPDQRSEAVICLTIPSMFLDVISVYCFPQLFPNLSPTTVAPFGAWLFWGYAIALVAGLAATNWKQYRD